MQKTEKKSFVIRFLATVPLIGLLLTIFVILPNQRGAAYENGYQVGLSEGYDSGQRDGYRDGTNDGYVSGLEEGKVSGYRSGYDDGLQKGKESTAAVVATSSAASGNSETNSATVYVSRNGVIHLRSNCSGMKYYTEMSYDAAVSAGYRKCSKCYK